MNVRIIWVIVVLVIVGTTLVDVRMPVGTAASQLEINNAIEEGLAYLNNMQASDGHWGGSFYPVACTAMAVLAFENAPNNHYGWNQTDPYSSTVQKGLDWLFTMSTVVPMTNQTAGTPDTNGNGIGICISSNGNDVYQSPMVLMAIVAASSNRTLAQTLVAATGPQNVQGRSYYDIAVDMVDWIAWAQNDAEANSGRGGWRYNANYGSSDNSLSQWPVLGLLTAHLWGIEAPNWVKTELLNYWATDSQNLDGNYSTNDYFGAFGYTNKYEFNSIAETAAGILELTYCNVNKTDPRIVAAQGYIVRNWNTSSDWNVNIGNFYAMYAVMKACRLAAPNAIQYIANYTGFPMIEWYNGTDMYADLLVNSQGDDGNWTQWVAPEAVDIDLSTAWGVLILEYVPVKVYWQLAVKVIDAINNAPLAGTVVEVGGQGNYSGTTNSNGQAVFSAVLAGFNTVSASLAGYLPGTVTVDLVENTEVTIALTPLNPLTRKARVEIHPETLNLKSKGNWVTCFIQLPQGFEVRDIDASTILLNETIQTETRPVSIGDSHLMVKFKRNVIEDLILLKCAWCSCATLTVTAQLYDGTVFEGSDNIRFKISGDVNKDGRTDVKDCALTAKAYGSHKGDSGWNPLADRNEDGKIDIRDMAIVNRDFGNKSV